MPFRFVLVLSITGMLVGAASAQETATARSEESWSVLTIAGQRAGYSREWVEWREKDGQRIRASAMEDVMSVSRFQQKLQMRSAILVEETSEGKLLSFRHEILTPPAAPTRISARVSGDCLLLANEVGGRTTNVEKAWKPEYLGPNAEVRLLRERPLKPGQSRSFAMFDLVRGAVITVRQTAAKEFAAEPLLDGSNKRLLKIRTELGPELTVDSYQDERGQIWKETTSVLGGIGKYRATRAEALKNIGGAELDLAAAMLVKVTPITNAHESRTAIYRVAVPAEDPGRLVATGATQQVSRIDENTIQLTVTSVLPPERPSPEARPVDRQYLDSNRYLQSDDARVRQYAQLAGGDETDSWKLAVRMEKWVASNLKSKNFSTVFASAAEVARDLAGDCTEHAVLLAAMCRARKVPSRIAVGLVYASSHTAFVGHAWTEVFVNGTWVPLDATLGRGRVGAAHIKFSDASLDGDGAAFHEFLPLMTALGKMRIEVVSVK